MNVTSLLELLRREQVTLLLGPYTTPRPLDLEDLSILCTNLRDTGGGRSVYHLWRTITSYTMLSISYNKAYLALLEQLVAKPNIFIASFSLLCPSLVASDNAVEAYGCFITARCPYCHSREVISSPNQLPPSCKCGRYMVPEILYNNCMMQDRVAIRIVHEASTSDVLLLVGFKHYDPFTATLAAYCRSLGVSIVEVAKNGKGLDCVANIRFHMDPLDFLKLLASY